MTIRRALLHGAWRLAAAGLLTFHAAAADRWWDGGAVNIATNGDGISFGGTGLWDATIQNWDPGSGLPHVAWNNGNNDTAIFAGTGATLTNGAALAANALLFNSANYVLATNSPGGSTITLAGTAPQIFTSGTTILNPNLAGSGGLTKNGAGTLTLRGLAPHGLAGGLTVNLGILELDFLNFIAPTNAVNSANTVSLGAGTFRVKGKSTGASSQAINGVVLTGGPAGISLNSNGGTGSLSLGAITRSPYAVLNFTLPALGSIATSAGNTNDLLGTWASTGSGAATRFATVSGGSIASLTGTAAPDEPGLTDSTGTVNYDLAAAGNVVPDTVVANTIRYTGAAGTTVAGATLFSVNGLLNAGAGVWTISGNPVTIGGDQELVIHAANNGLTISSVIQDSAGGASRLTITGSANGNGPSRPVTLNGANTYTGPTTLNGTSGTGDSVRTITLSGALRNAGVNSEFGAGSSLVLNGAIIQTAATGSSDRAITLNGNSGFLLKGFTQTLTGPLTGPGSLSADGDYNGGAAGGNGNLVLSASNDFTGEVLLQTDGRITLNHVDALSRATLSMSGTRILADLTTYNLACVLGGLKGSVGLNLGTGLGGGGNGAVFIGNNHQSTTYSGTLSGAAGLVKIGTGTLTLSGTNTYTGNTTVDNGVLALSGYGSVGSTNFILHASGTLSVASRADGLLSLAAGQSLSGNGTLTGNLVVNNNALLAPGAGVGTLTNHGNASWQGGGTYQWEINRTNAGGQDGLLVSGVLTNQATSTNRFKIHIVSLNDSGVPGPLAGGFDASRDQGWRIATAAGGLSGFTSDAFAFVDSFTAHNGGSGTFVVTNVGNDVWLVYKAAFVATPPSAGTPNPTNFVVWLGGSVTFTLSATGTGPLTHQWRFNGTDLPGETGASLTLDGLQLAQSGSYDCVVSSPYPPAATSSVAVLTVHRFVANAGYRLGEAGVGTNHRPTDSSGYGHDFASDVNGARTVVSGDRPAPGSTLYYVFDGTAGYSGIGWDPPEDDVGVECWVRVADLSQTGKEIFGTGHRGGAVGDGINLCFDSAGLNAALGYGAGIQTVFGTPYLPSSTNEWVHVAAVRASGKLTFYVNGVQSGASLTATPQASTTPYLGKTETAGGFDGAIDEARIFTFAPGQFQPSDLGFYQGIAPGTPLHPKPWFSAAATHTTYVNARDFVAYSGWWDLWYRYRGRLPFGSGVEVAQVENSVPNILGFPDKRFTLDPVDALPDPGGHADTVGRICYGSPCYQDANATFEYGFGRGVTNIAAYTGDAFRNDVLQISAYNTRGGSLPGWNLGKRQVLNISNSLGYGGEDNTIRALDYLVEVENVLACTAMPGSAEGDYNGTLSGNQWNGLVVAQNGPRNNGWNGAQYENAGAHPRVKPDLVTSDYIGGRTGGASSWTTPTVAGAAAFLLEAARATNTTVHATNNYVLKAILLAGASKSGLVSPVWDGTAIVDWDLTTPYTYSNHPPGQPLDRLFGAGLFNLNNAYTILAAGEQPRTATNQPIGWAQGTGLNAGAEHAYWFHVSQPKPDFVATLVWNRHIQDNAGVSFDWYLTDLKLELYTAGGQLLARSDDPGNNVEQVYLPQGLGAGLYCLKVSSPSPTNESYGLAWRTACPTAVPEAVACVPQPNGTMNVVFQGVPSQPYRLYQSSNLAWGIWTPVATGVSDASGRVELTDPAPPAEAAFYRAGFDY